MDYSEEKQELLNDVSSIEQELRLPSGFMQSLEEEDDWSFIIKSHALIEASLSTWLVSHLDQPELKEPLSYIDIGHAKYGKVALTASLGLTTPYDRKFINNLTKLRNLLAHGVDYISFDLNDYISSLDKNQKKQFFDAFSYFYIRADSNGAPIYPNKEVVINEPKQAIYLGVLLSLALISTIMENTRLKREGDNLGLIILKLQAKLSNEQHIDENF